MVCVQTRATNKHVAMDTEETTVPGVSNEQLNNSVNLKVMQYNLKSIFDNDHVMHM